jgi:hypothetical protein
MPDRLDFEVFTTTESSSILLKSDPLALNMLCATLAVNIMQTCRENDPNPEKRMERGSMGILSRRMRWADHGLINALHYQVKFLHSMVKTVVNNPKNNFLLGIFDPCIITDALVEYKQWKDRMHFIDEREQQRSITNSDFYNYDCTADNEAFLKLRKPS